MEFLVTPDEHLWNHRQKTEILFYFLAAITDDRIVLSRNTVSLGKDKPIKLFVELKQQIDGIFVKRRKMSQPGKLVFECLKAWLGGLWRFLEPGENRRLSVGFEQAVSDIELLVGEFANLVPGKQHEHIRRSDLLVVLILRARLRHMRGKVFPNIEMEKYLFLREKLVLAIDFNFKRLPVCFQLAGRGEKYSDRSHSRGLVGVECTRRKFVKKLGNAWGFCLQEVV
ncbi:MAG: hypothetical protein HGB15_11305 [Chlorobaculum sp.]|nr:hypothetical protein [Chlorobaculum sp.]